MLFTWPMASMSQRTVTGQEVEPARTGLSFSLTGCSSPEDGDWQEPVPWGIYDSEEGHGTRGFRRRHSGAAANRGWSTSSWIMDPLGFPKGTSRGEDPTSTAAEKLEEETGIETRASFPATFSACRYFYRGRKRMPRKSSSISWPRRPAHDVTSPMSTRIHVGFLRGTLYRLTSDRLRSSHEGSRVSRRKHRALE